MSGRRIKNLILLILALAVCFLLLAVVPGKLSAQREESALHRGLTELLASYGVSIDPALLTPGETLYAIELENPDASNAAQALLGSKYTAGETAARMLASCTSELGSMQLSRAGELTARLTGATQAHDLARATRRYLRSMDFAVASVSEPLRESAGVYSVTAVQCAYRKARASPARTLWCACFRAATASAGWEVKFFPASRGTFTRKRPRARCALCRSGGSKPTRARSMSAVLRARYVSWCRKGANVRVEILKNL